MPKLPRRGTQEAHVLEFLSDGRPHIVWDRGWPDGSYTGRNAISRLKAKGWPITSWRPKGERYQRYQLDTSQLGVNLAREYGREGRSAKTAHRSVPTPAGDGHGAHAVQACLGGLGELGEVIG
jgi:hypothetical protein